MKSGHGKDNIRTNAALVYQYGHFLEKIKVSVAGQTVRSNSAGDSCIQKLPHRRQTIPNKKITARTEADSRSGTLHHTHCESRQKARPEITWGVLDYFYIPARQHFPD